jgi:hypothetical protein
MVFFHDPDFNHEWIQEISLHHASLEHQLSHHKKHNNVQLVTNVAEQSSITYQLRSINRYLMKHKDISNHSFWKKLFHQDMVAFSEVESFVHFLQNIYSLSSLDDKSVVISFLDDSLKILRNSWPFKSTFVEKLTTLKRLIQSSTDLNMFIDKKVLRRMLSSYELHKNIGMRSVKNIQYEREIAVLNAEYINPEIIAQHLRH